MSELRSAIVTVAVLLGVVLGLASCGDDDVGDADTQAMTASELVDTFLRGWNENDPDVVPSVFTEDGRYVSFAGSSLQGREQISDYLRDRSRFIEDAARVGEASEGDDGTFVMVVELDVAGEPRRGTAAVELDGDLASRIFWVEDPAPIQ